MLRELANAGDSIANAFTLLTYPFPDSLFTGESNGGGTARALSSCSADSGDNAQSVRNGACFGDYINLDINLALNPQQAAELLAGILSIGGVTLPFSAATQSTATQQGQALPKLPDLLGGLNPKPQSSGGPQVVCTLLSLCRAPASSPAKAEQSDVGRLLVGPAMTS